MNPRISIIMGSISDLPVLQRSAAVLNGFEIPFEMLILSAHRTPGEVETFAKTAASRGVETIIAAAGMAAHLPGVIAALTVLPVIGLPINAGMSGVDALLSMTQMPQGVPVATVGVNAAENAALLAAQILSLSDKTLQERLSTHRATLRDKTLQAAGDLQAVKYPFKTN
jgi:5-(carboxyamino)imidazole ribonucleotide mutase